MLLSLERDGCDIFRSVRDSNPRIFNGAFSVDDTQKVAQGNTNVYFLHIPWCNAGKRFGVFFIEMEGTEKPNASSL